jgi:hypothetical protein
MIKTDKMVALDFQDARWGGFLYDVISLFKLLNSWFNLFALSISSQKLGWFIIDSISCILFSLESISKRPPYYI